eukprot:scaffold1219_cov220-Pinguiococcus_pyrenoidosus.AAC.1
MALRFLRDPLLEDKDIALRAVKINVACAFHLAPAFRSDPDVMLLARSKEASAWGRLLSKELWEDRSYALNAVTVAPGMFPHLAFRFCDVREYVLAAIRVGNPTALRWTKNPAIGKDEEILRLAVNQNGLLLQYASPRLQDDQDIVRIAIRGSDTLEPNLACAPTATLEDRAWKRWA